MHVTYFSHSIQYHYRSQFSSRELLRDIRDYLVIYKVYSTFTSTLYAFSTTMDYNLENRTCAVFQNVPFSAVDLANFLKSTIFLYFWKPCSCAHHYSTAVAVLGGLLVCLLVGYQARDTTCTVGSY